MIACPRCGRDDDGASAYCQGCGQALRPSAEPDRFCSGCGSRLESGFRFCGRCGRAVPATPPRAGSLAPGGAAAAPASVALDLEQPAAHGSPVPGVRAAPSVLAVPGVQVVVVRADGLPGAVHALGPAGLLCGRARGDIRFPDDATVSPEHARFTARGSGAVVADLGSLNGTFVRLRAPRALQHGDEVRLGRQLLRVEPVPRAVVGLGARPWGSADPGHRLRLVQVLEGGTVGEVFPLAAGESLIGREAGQVSFPSDRYVSARHARIEVGGSGITLSDLGSSNGTFVRVSPAAPMAPGDQVLVGMQLLRIDG